MYRLFILTVVSLLAFGSTASAAVDIQRSESPVVSAELMSKDRALTVHLDGSMRISSYDSATMQFTSVSWLNSDPVLDGVRTPRLTLVATWMSGGIQQRVETPVWDKGYQAIVDASMAHHDAIDLMQNLFPVDLPSNGTTKLRLVPSDVQHRPERNLLMVA